MFLLLPTTHYTIHLEQLHSLGWVNKKLCRHSPMIILLVVLLLGLLENVASDHVTNSHNLLNLIIFTNYYFKIYHGVLNSQKKYVRLPAVIVTSLFHNLKINSIVSCQYIAWWWNYVLNLGGLMSLIAYSCYTYFIQFIIFHSSSINSLESKSYSRALLLSMCLLHVQVFLPFLLFYFH